ncbi:MAG: aerotolerance regulator BatA, partial [Myxococcales bacterium]|nr:aerotolerance regulator BatA [Myxococcales bacterium]
LKTIAKDTGGLFYSAGDDRELASSFEAIRKNLPQSSASVTGRMPHLQLFDMLLWPAFILLLLELVLRMTRFRSFP